MVLFLKKWELLITTGGNSLLIKIYNNNINNTRPFFTERHDLMCCIDVYVRVIPTVASFPPASQVVEFGRNTWDRQRDFGIPDNTSVSRRMIMVEYSSMNISFLGIYCQLTKFSYS